MKVKNYEALLRISGKLEALACVEENEGAGDVLTDVLEVVDRILAEEAPDDER